MLYCQILLWWQENPFLKYYDKDQDQDNTGRYSIHGNSSDWEYELDGGFVLLTAGNGTDILMQTSSYLV